MRDETEHQKTKKTRIFEMFVYESLNFQSDLRWVQFHHAWVQSYLALVISHLS